MGTEPVEASATDSGSARTKVHQADARHDLVEVHHVHAPVDSLLAAVEEVVAESVAVDAGGEDWLGLPVVPIALRRLTLDVPADVVQQMCRRRLLVGPR